jgi:hypothetical protein
MFDVDRTDAAEVRSGYVNMALMAGLAMEGERLPAGAVMPGREFTEDMWLSASFAIARMTEHRLNMTLLDMEEMQPAHDPGAFNVPGRRCPALSDPRPGIAAPNRPHSRSAYCRWASSMWVT